ncbi:MAG: chemotaxis protein CheW [Methyloligellaceae bacterium]
MDDLLTEFLTETSESLDVIDNELVRFEQEPNNAEILDNIFRLVHTIKGTCGFLGLPRLEALAHAGETLMGQYRDGVPVRPEGVQLILESIDRLKEILGELEQTGAEPAGSDADLISPLERMAVEGDAPPEASAPEPVEEPEPERELRPGEVSEEDLERAFQEADGPEGLDISPDSAAAAAADAAGDAAPAEPQTQDDAPAATAAESEPAAADPADGSGDAGQAARGGKEAPVKTQSIRVNVDTLEHLMTMVSELVLTRNQLLEMVRRLDESEFKVPLQRLSGVTAELQEGVMKTRMQPIGNAWQKLPRIVRDLSRELDKKIELEMKGADTELDRQVLEMIKDPLTHMVRNSADHGLEPTADRPGAGKPDVGTITLSAYHEGGHIIIEVADDGRGLNSEKIKAKVVQNGLASEADLEKMTEHQIHKFIFNAGFSTAAEVTSVSGRGVGMDVVRTNIELIGGSVDVKSTEGEGTAFIIKIPLTLAIVSALIVEAADQRFAIPQLSVVELVRTHKNAEHRIEMINETPVLRLRNKLLPLMRLSKLLNMEQSSEEEDATEDTDQSFFVVVIQVGAQFFGIVVDSVFDTEEIVVKPMSGMLRDISMFSGNTILGDGSVIMIIDPNGIAQQVASVATAENAQQEDNRQVADQGGDQTTALLLFRAGTDEPKAVPLSLVTRLEEIDVKEIEQANGRALVQYRGVLMPLVFVEGHSELNSEGQQPMLVFSDERRSMGLVVDEIVDIVEEKLKVEISSDQPGMIGSAVLKEKATEIIDMGHYLAQAFDDWLDEKDGRGIEFGTRLLLVDDSAFFRNMLAPLLGAAGYSVTMAESAKEALRLKDQGACFDVIVSDIEMPEMDGIAFAESVRADGRWGKTPIIALSSHSAPQVIERSRQAGFVDFVGKFDRQGLIESLKDCSQQLGAAA